MTVSRGNYNIYEQLTSARLVSASNVSGNYYNGPTNSGVGATLTGAASTLTVDGVLVDDGDRILLQGQTAPYQNGVYDKSTVDGVFVLTRAADFQNIEQLKGGQYITISEGASNGGSIWVLLSPLPEHFGVISVTTENDIVFYASGLNGGFGTAAEKDASDNTKATLASINGATVIGHVPKFSDIAGTIEDGGVAVSALQLSANIKAATTSNIGGAGAGPLTVVVAGLTANSVVVASVESSSNPASVIACTAGVGSFDITLSADPGASCLVNYVAFIAAQ